MATGSRVCQYILQDENEKNFIKQNKTYVISPPKYVVLMPDL